MITSLGFRAKVGLHKYKRARYAIINVSKKELSKIIRKSEKFEKLPYDKKRLKHEPTDSYFYLARQLAKCMMRADTINWHGKGGYKEITALSSNIFSMEEDKLKRIIVHKILSQSCSTNEDKSKLIIVNETLSQNYSTDVDELGSTEEDKSECTITEQKYAENEVTYDVPYNFNVSNVFECGINNPDVSCKRAYMASERDEYFTEIIDNLNEYNDRHGQRLSSKKLKEAVLQVMEEEEEDIKRNINNIT